MSADTLSHRKPGPAAPRTDAAETNLRQLQHCHTAWGSSTCDTVSLCSLLSLLRWRLPTLLLCGTAALTSSFPFVQPFPKLPFQQREAALQAWSTSWLPQLRKVGHTA